MKFTVEIGIQEKHIVSYHFNKFWGNLKITVDGKAIKKDLRTYSLSMSNLYEFEIGDNEKHIVKIEKIRPQLMAGFRSNTYKVYVDGDLFKEIKD